jgi:hypothetical protein
MAATNPSGEPDDVSARSRPTLASGPSSPSRRWIAVVIGVVVVAAALIVGYMLLYNGGGSGSGSGSGGGGTGGGYVILAVGAGAIDRLIRRVRRP